MSPNAHFCTPIFVVSLAITGCTSTITPAPVASHQASFDGNAQNSGVLSVNPAGYVVTPHFRDRYNALVRTYGHDFRPAVEADAGLIATIDGTWLIDRQHMNYFLEMNAWLRAGLKPANP